MYKWRTEQLLTKNVAAPYAVTVTLLYSFFIKELILLSFHREVIKTPVKTLRRHFKNPEMKNSKV